MSSSSAEPKSGLVVFRPRARLLKLIGAELISDDVVAVTELVKNAYDADATRVVIRFENVTDPGGTITVLDDGHGMDRETLLGGWMEPAASSKRGEHRKISQGGRWMLGEKGLGRFAADKLGKALELISRRKGSAAEVRAVFDWEQFENEDAMLGEVRNHWEIRPAEELKAQGTLLKITGLRTHWNERMFRRLTTRLARLRSPYESKNGFSIVIESDEFPLYSGELASGFLDAAPYSVEAEFDGETSLEVKLNGGKAVTTPWTGPALTCGPINVRLRAFDLETEAISKLGPRVEVKGWLREWCGVSIYRDGFRVWPYGEPHDDWLRLDQRRVNNPVSLPQQQPGRRLHRDLPEAEPGAEGSDQPRGALQQPGPGRPSAADALHLSAPGGRAAVGETPRWPWSWRRCQKPLENPSNSDLEKLRKLAETVGGKAGAELRGIASRVEFEWTKREKDTTALVEQYAQLAARGHSMVGATTGLGETISKVRKGVGQMRSDMATGGGLALGGLLEVEKSLSGLESKLDLIAALSEGSAGRRRSIRSSGRAARDQEPLRAHA